MYRACELKDQTYKKTRTLHFSDKSLFASGPIKTSKYTGKQGGRARYNVALPPFISFVLSPGRPVICNVCSFLLFSALLHPFALFCGLTFKLIFALLRAFACFCVRPRLEQPRLGTADLFGALWKMPRTLRVISCGHFPWKLKDENLRNKIANVSHIFRQSLAKLSPALRPRRLRA